MDLYDLLGIRRSASATEIRRAFQRKSRQLHPAVNPGDAAAAEHFQAVAQAFEILSDARRRAAYDRGEQPVQVTTAFTGVLFEGFDFQTPQSAGASFRDIFSPGDDKADKASARGEDLEQTARITFEESLSGARRRG